MRSALMRSKRAKMEWNVPIHSCDDTSLPTKSVMRERISRAALLVNVRAMMRYGFMPKCNRCTIL